MDENAKTIQREIAKDKIQIILSSIAMAVLVIMEFYIMINYKSNFMAMAVGILLMIVALFFLISAILDISLKQKDLEQEKYEEIYNAQKASYLVIKKSFDEMEQRLRTIEENSSLPAEDIINAQKAVAKVTISRSKENTDALMNSNDELINQLVNIQEKLESNNSQIIEKQQSLLKETNFDLQQKIAALTSQISSIEGRIQGGIPVQAMQSVQMLTPPSQASAPETPAVEETPIAEELPVMDEIPVDMPSIEELPAMEDMPAMEEMSAMDELPIEEPPVSEEPVVEDLGLDLDIAAEPATDDLGLDLDSMVEEIQEGPIPEEQPLDEEVPIEETSVEEIVAEEPVAEELSVEETPAEEPVAEELLVEETPAEEPVAEELLVEPEDPGVSLDALLEEIGETVEEPEPEPEEETVEEIDYSIYADESLGIDGKVGADLRDYRNILIAGIDNGNRSDMLIVLSINKDSGDAKMFTVSRDTYMQIAHGETVTIGEHELEFCKCNRAF